ncbi:PREDICTED: caspase recruitment domain-containing protein 8-like isoform X2 [Cyprinodon variegatus]|uniref:caspase recruitment domain-containing protein 8-like isoform X2 n=1 Tax=Cyprinodon variegatus TaxID=28743 RepID=UPI00074278E3|nr:PREDICTED: caspase recruitment domain-containing protein 8-like isoform X2 [Cyprinodon variegatus]
METTEQLVETLNQLSVTDFKEFKALIQPETNLELDSSSCLKEANIQDVVNWMVERFKEECVEETKKILLKMGRPDLVQRLAATDSGVKGCSASETCGVSYREGDAAFRDFDAGQTGGLIKLLGDHMIKNKVAKDYRRWIKLKPEVKVKGPRDAPTYSLRSEAGRFECSVSGLRWFCQEKVAFRYRFCSWDGHMERMESRGYRPAGPLMDITVSTGTMLEVQLPHWVYIDVPELLDNFAVLHVTDYGDVLEKVAQVTETHVTLTEPAFSLLGCLLNIFFSPRINCCNTLIYYQPNKPFLKLHVYLILPDPALKQSIYKDETSGGYEAIKKPHPDQRLKMDCGFTLKASVETAHIQPPQITLRHVSQDPNFYEVFIENPDRRFNLELLQTGSETVWFCEIRKGQFVP